MSGDVQSIEDKLVLDNGATVSVPQQSDQEKPLYEAQRIHNVCKKQMKYPFERVKKIVQGVIYYGGSSASKATIMGFIDFPDENKENNVLDACLMALIKDNWIEEIYEKGQKRYIATEEGRGKWRGWLYEKFGKRIPENLQPDWETRRRFRQLRIYR